jgi:predicted dinucleotide-binding enzyme
MPAGWRRMGRGIGTRLAAGGHSVTFVDAAPETAEKTAAGTKVVKAFNTTYASTLIAGQVQGQSWTCSLQGMTPMQRML